MSPAATLRLASRALLRNKLRSFLTALGVVIGVGAVIAMVAIGEGAKSRVEQTFQSMGTNVLVVLSGSSLGGGMHGGFGTQLTLTWDDLKAIQTEIPTVRAAAPMLRVSGVVQSEDLNWTTAIIGTTPEYHLIRNAPIASGRGLQQSDVEGDVKIAVLGQTVIEKLYGAGVDPVGQMVRIKGVPFQVVGVLVKKGQSPMGLDYDDTVVVPVSSFRSKLQGGLGKFI
ncbi:MAG: Macrolide export ATP-binding/permease protein MacB, partial [Myxococcaceae bacterium]|nr:Macrolide export ATP-binding/permease protein MacB [Myxococcaceae bacterium]